MRGWAVVCVHCYYPTVPLPSSRYCLSFLITSLVHICPIRLPQLSRHDDALVDTEACLLLQPGWFKALRTRARIRLHKEQYEDAISDFRAALKQAELESAAADVRALQGELKCAEEALDRIETKDYYTVLGVPRDCTKADIKKAYRRQSLKHHPDKVRSSLSLWWVTCKTFFLGSLLG
jgi:tetratricopeptide (TPR) repeat protein